MVNNHYKLEKILISSSAHFRSLKLKAYFKDTKDLYFDGLPTKYINNSMTRMQGNRYLTNAYDLATRKHVSYWVDVGTMKIERLELDSEFGTSNCYIEGDYMLLVRFGGQIAILRDLK